MVDLLVIKNLVENSVAPMKRAPTTHMLAGNLTNLVPMTDVLRSSLDGGIYALHQTIKEAQQVEHRKHVSQQQRHCWKERTNLFPAVRSF